MIDNVFGLNLNLLDISLKIIYNSMKDAKNLNTFNCKENQKFFTVDVYISDEIIDIVKKDTVEDYPDKYLAEIQKIFDYKRHKVILKIDFMDTEDINKKIANELSIETGNNFLVCRRETEHFEVLNEFFKKYADYISFRKILKGTIKKEYYEICKLIFFNSNIYKYDSGKFEALPQTIGDANACAD